MTIETPTSPQSSVWPSGVRRRVLGVRVDDVTLDETLAIMRAAIASGTPCHVITLNPEYVMRARADAALRAIIGGAAVVTADGAGITQAARLADLPLRARVTGNDLTDAIAKVGIPVFLLGAAPGVAEAAADALQLRHSAAQVVGTWSGSAEPVDDEEARRRINGSGAQVVLVAYGMPRQDRWIDRNLPALAPPVAIGVGGTFDYLAGRIPRAPRWMRARGLEWLYRLMRQPSRLPRIVRVWQFGAMAGVAALVSRLRREGQ